jgi:DNA helicase-2/ATP-dependent DNA helicase PcrA
VFVLNSVDGCIPSDLGTGTSEEIEEERRLLYVAMTRAKNQLDLIVPQRFYVHGQAKGGDRHVYAGRTRFVPASVLQLFDVRAWPAAAERSPTFQARPQVRVDIAARMRARWR